jgi:hypothetical protein
VAEWGQPGEGPWQINKKAPTSGGCLWRLNSIDQTAKKSTDSFAVSKVVLSTALKSAKAGEIGEISEIG